MQLSFEEVRKQYSERFKDHKATLLMNTDRYASIDFRNKNGSSCYYVNFLIDKLTGMLVVSGDLGTCVAQWFNKVNLTELKSLVSESPQYFVSKFQCASDQYYYDAEQIFGALVEFYGKDELDDVDKVYEGDTDNSIFDDLKCAIEYSITCGDTVFSPSSRLIYLWQDILGCDLYDLYGFPEKLIDTRVYLWMIAFEKACEQLGL